MTTRITLRASSPKPLWVIRKVNGQPFPILPQSIVQELYVVDRDSHEDTNGNLQRFILGHKDKFLLTFPAMNQLTMDEILARVPTGAFDVEYEDFFNPKKIRTQKFYRGDVKKTPYMVIGTKGSEYIYDAGFGFNLIPYNVYKD